MFFVFNHADLIHLIKMNREKKACQAALSLLIENKSPNPCVIFEYKLDKREPLVHLQEVSVCRRPSFTCLLWKQFFIPLRSCALPLCCFSTENLPSYTEIEILKERYDQHFKH